MKIIILTVGHSHANYIVKKVIDEFGDEIDIIAESSVLLSNKSFSQALKKYISVSGYEYVIAQGIKLLNFKLISAISRTNYKSLASRRKIRVVKVKDANSQKFVQILKKSKPDIIVSIFFNQIINSQVINQASKAVINIHPGLLPNYKGVSPVFWTLANGEQYGGVSIHYIDRGIDTGEIIAKKKIKVIDVDTENSLYQKLSILGAPLLIDMIHRLVKSKTKVPGRSNRKGTYFSLPTKTAIRMFRQRGRQFI